MKDDYYSYGMEDMHIMNGEHAKVKEVTLIINAKVEVSYRGIYTDPQNDDYLKHQLKQIEQQINNNYDIYDVEIEDIL